MAKTYPASEKKPDMARTCNGAQSCEYSCVKRVLKDLENHGDKWYIHIFLHSDDDLRQ